jgi:hypothetical protein
MTRRYTVNLPLELKKEAEALGKRQGVSLNQFILWSVAEKVSALKAGPMRLNRLVWRLA